MADIPSQPPVQTKQRVIATICIVVISLAYLAGYVQWRQWLGQPRRSLASAQLMNLSSQRSPDGLAYAPDFVLPPIKDSMAPVIAKIITKQPVVFLTIDDGVYREPEAAAKLRAAGVPASLFLVQRYVSQTPGYFANIVHQSGSVIEDHTLDHKDLSLLSYEDQRREVCTTADIFAQVYGKRPRLFRPPYGDYNAATLRAAADCGMRAVMMWHEVIQNGAVQYQLGDKLQPGDIVLMHFTPSFKQDLQAFVDAAGASGLHPQLLENWIAR